MVENQVILLKNDYEVLNEYVKNLHGMQVNEKENFRKLSQELGKAQLVDAADFPLDIVRLDSTVVIRDRANQARHDYYDCDATKRRH